MVNTWTIIVTDFPILCVICFKDSNFALTMKKHHSYLDSIQLHCIKPSSYFLLYRNSFKCDVWKTVEDTASKGTYSKEKAYQPERTVNLQIILVID